MKAIRAIGHDVVLISETSCQLGSEGINHEVDPIFILRQTENAFWFLENCAELVPRMRTFRVPGNG